MKIIFFCMLFGLGVCFFSCSDSSSNQSVPEPKINASVQNQNSEHIRFVKEYEAFKNDYCKSGMLFKEATLTQKIEVAQKMVTFTEKINEYNPVLTGIRASGDKATLKRLDELEAEIKQCDKLWEME